MMKTYNKALSTFPGGRLVKLVTIKEVIIGKELKVAVPIMPNTQEELVEKINRVNKSSAHMVEWRIDYFSNRNNIVTSLKLLRQLTDKLILVTFRRKEEGGFDFISINDYENLLKIIIESGYADIVDVELSVERSVIERLRLIANQTNTKLLYSAHFFTYTPRVVEMLQLLKGMEELQADLTKLAVMPNSMEDVLSLMQLTNTWNKQATVPFITIAMGELGKITRYSGQLFGSCVTFASIDKTSAPGQMKVENLQKILDLI